jgi:amino acid transporter
MGRSEAIPKSFFAKLHAKRGIPANNVMLIGVLALAGALCDMLREPFRISYEKGAEMLNFGAFIAFMGVNVAAFVRYFLRAERRTVWNFAWPVCGFGICAYIWWELSTPAKILGAAWLTIGLLYGAWKTSGFRKAMSFDAPAE